MSITAEICIITQPSFFWPCEAASASPGGAGIAGACSCCLLRSDDCNEGEDRATAWLWGLSIAELFRMSSKNSAGANILRYGSLHSCSNFSPAGRVAAVARSITLDVVVVAKNVSLLRLAGGTPADGVAWRGDRRNSRCVLSTFFTSTYASDAAVVVGRYRSRRGRDKKSLNSLFQSVAKTKEVSHL